MEIIGVGKGGKGLPVEAVEKYRLLFGFSDGLQSSPHSGILD